MAATMVVTKVEKKALKLAGSWVAGLVACLVGPWVDCLVVDSAEQKAELMVDLSVESMVL